MTEPAGIAGVAERLPELWARFRPGIMARVERLEEAVVALLGGQLTPEQRREAEREAHKLAGSVGTFGHAEASGHARTIEVALEGNRAFDERDALLLSDAVLALRASLERVPAPELPRGERPEVLLVSDDEELAERVGMEAAARGIVFHRARDAAGAATLLERVSPAAAVVDLAIGGGGEGSLALLDRFVAARRAPVLVAVAPTDSFADRIAAVRRGASVYLPRPTSPLQVVDSVERALRRGPASGASVLVVDDDAHVLQLVAAVLGARGMQVHTAADAASFWRDLQLHAPEAVVLDVDMPELNGIELCRAVRADPRWSDLPVIFLTTRTDAATVAAVFEAGADDFVAKPVVGPELARRIDNRIARSGASAEAAAGMRGLPGRVGARNTLRRLVQLAARVSVPLTIVRVAMTPAAGIDRSLGAGAAIQARERMGAVLESAVEPGDVVGWWGGGDFVLGCFGSEPPAVASRLERARRLLAADRAEVGDAIVSLDFSAGMAALRSDGNDIEALLAAAERELTVAIEEGAGPARPGDATATTRRATEVVDVVVVEDDSVIAELLLHAMTVQGYSARWISDGEEAIQRLAGPAPSLRARVVLLDVDLPGRDGLGVLLELARSRTTARTRVVMLTVRSTEREVLAALELGAADHVAKPFSVPVLLRRVRALLERG